MTYLYRHFDKDGALLYVGISLSAVQRLGQHKDHSHWFQQIARVEIEEHPTRAAALLAESKAIRDENPKFNIIRPLTGTYLRLADNKVPGSKRAPRNP